MRPLILDRRGVPNNTESGGYFIFGADPTGIDANN